MGCHGSKEKKHAKDEFTARQRSPARPAARPTAPPSRPAGVDSNFRYINGPPQVQQSSTTVTVPPSSNPKPSATTTAQKPVQQKVDTTILGKPYEDIKKFYTLGKELGRGQFGITYFCTENSTGLNYACKSILKRKLVSKADREDIKREIQILQHLSGQPNIVEFKGAFEDRFSVHLVMELCAGGELFDRIIAQGHYSERAAASICRDVVKVVHICHFMGVLHRDLKPENFLLSSKDDGAALKATDFGLSVFIEEGAAAFALLVYLCKFIIVVYYPCQCLNYVIFDCSQNFLSLLILFASG